MPRAELALPSKFRRLLQKSSYEGEVLKACNRYAEVFSDPAIGLYFFPEFTDHGPTHIASIFNTSESLISGPSWKRLTGDDAAAFLLAVLFHDAAMHLTADGLIGLVEQQKGKSNPLIPDLDRESWGELFHDFYVEAKRWDSRKLFNILGDKDSSVSVDLSQYVCRPTDIPDSETWSTRQRKFFGEFVRRHHARLAHEIAVKGFPGNETLIHSPDLPESFKDLVGIIARSHNMPLRSTFSYLNSKFGGHTTCIQTHPLFLMALLRISDYLELKADRVSKTATSLRRLRSPLSSREWNKHFAVNEVRADDQDLEGIYVHCSPRTSENFFDLKRMLGGLQQELDQVWAVFGEVFGRLPELQALGISIRRVRSNLDDDHAQSTWPFWPIETSFRSAGSELLKRLILPLYGDRPDIGVRELLQNAVDAVREREALEATHAPIKPSRKTSEPAIVISLTRSAENEWTLTVTDRGIGMTADTVHLYYLNAGASFRQSETWQTLFQPDGVAKVLRSGRFGIGALAAFLIGPRLSVTTRHLLAEKSAGVSFEVTLLDEQVELKRIYVEKPGTTISIIIPHAKAEVLESLAKAGNWYRESEPGIEFRRDKNVISRDAPLPSPTDERLPIGWRKIVTSKYPAIIWTYDRVPNLVCNGFKVREVTGFGRHRESIKEDPTELRWEERNIIFQVPNTSVSDPNGLLPLNLNRTDLVRRNYPESEALLRDVAKDFVAYSLVMAPTAPLSDGNREDYCRSYPGLRSGFVPDWTRSPWISALEGAVFFHPWHIRYANLNALTVVIVEDNFSMPTGKWHIHKGHGLIINQSWASYALFSNYVGWLFGEGRMYRGFDPFHRYQTLGRRVVVPPDHIDRHDAFLEFEPDEAIPSPDKVSWTSWYALEKGRVPKKPKLLQLRSQLQGCLAAGEWYFDVKARVDPSTVEKMWDDLLGQALIPYDPQDRRKRFKDAYKQLGPQIRAWEKSLAQLKSKQRSNAGTRRAK